MSRRFVILKHDHPYLHWDLLLEEECSARTWRLLRKPCLGEPIAAEPLASHRLMYLDYEGPLSHQRGSVERFSGGFYDLVQADDACHLLSLSDNAFATEARIITLPDGRVFVEFGSSAALGKAMVNNVLL